MMRLYEQGSSHRLKAVDFRLWKTKGFIYEIRKRLFDIMKILVWYYWRSRSESAFIDVIYSVGVIPEIFLNCLEK